MLIANIIAGSFALNGPGLFTSLEPGFIMKGPFLCTILVLCFGIILVFNSY
jgi:hypothetical protein